MSTSKINSQHTKSRSNVTIVDIARLAGVNPSTVSRALSGSQSVTEETRDKISAIARENGYVANHSARMLRSGRADQILVIVPNIAAFAHPEVILGIEEALEEHNIGVIVGSTKGNHERELALARQLVTGAADGLILLNGSLPNELSELRQYTRRIVAVSRPVDFPGVAFVGIDNEAAAFEATQYLISLGRTRIIHFAGPQQSAVFDARAKGYRDAMAEAGLHVNAEVVHLPLFNIAPGRQAMREILTRRHLPDAVLCASDELAFGAMHASRELGIKVPDQIAFVGFDNHPVGEAFSPPLTTVAVPRRNLGYVGAQTLLRSMSGDHSDFSPQLLPYELIVRESCGRNRL
ncbi:LacI family transcriptional regulator [Agrobacterium tumefaciens]|uniref:LacI family DNA-binding transcriptional regulator n=1 Tax=Agrobacterium tumefaciens TaxID=358 RepID=UPI0021CEF2A6|nr:LacI family DNA-binding transcriptional regulator [Agrobacterium tumefaciens]UXS53062.1 LacI family transcriptional regulator [Agrobacterium tumefaciens]UXS63306.1 LacI family transcriptional regulator [Agrobacterium tumefaciens]